MSDTTIESRTYKVLDVTDWDIEKVLNAPENVHYEPVYMYAIAPQTITTTGGPDGTYLGLTNLQTRIILRRRGW